jgi:hypothetical protein
MSLIVLLLQLFVCVLLAAWFVITAMNQTQRTRKLVNGLVTYDVCGLVPIWTFFAPNPGDTDTHLLFRDRDSDGRSTNWKEVKLLRRDSMFDLWCPLRRINKSLVDVAFDLSKPDDWNRKESPQPVSKQRVLGFPYLLVLNYVSNLSGDFAAVERQFAIVKTAGYKYRHMPDVLLVSAFHKLAL